MIDSIDLGLVKAIHIGLTSPSNTVMLWYDDNISEKIHKWYNTLTSTWEPLVPTVASSGWQLDGNSNGAEKYFGTNDNHDIPLYTNGLVRGVFDKGGNFGFGTTSSSARVHIKGVDATSSNYSLKIDNSAFSPLLYIQNDGYIGVGTASPNALMDIVAANATPFAFSIRNSTHTANTTFGYKIYQENSGYMTFYMDGAKYMSISPNGNVSYSKSSYTSLDTQLISQAFAAGNASYGFYCRGYLSNNGLSVDGDGNVGINQFTATAKLHIKGIDATSSNYALKVDNSASSPLLYVRNDGNIGIGTSSPSYALDVKGTGIIAQFSDLSVTGAIASLSSKLMFGSTSNHDLSFLTVGSERMTISNSGNVGIGTTSASARLHVKGIDATSANYALKVDNSASSPLLYVRNDGEIGMNGFTIRQLSSTTYFKTSGTGGYMFNNAADSTNLGKITNTGQILFGDISDTNYVGVGIAVKALSLSSNASKEVFASFFKSNTDQDGLYFSSKQGSVYIQPYAVNSVNQSLILGGRDSGTGVLETLILKSSGVINTPTLPTSNAGLSTGDLYVETAANILANGDKVVGWKV